MPILPIALLLDAIVGYPERLFSAIGHPVILMGRFVSLGDRYLNKPHYDVRTRYLFGCLWFAIMVSTVVLVGIALAWLLTGWWQLLKLLLVSSLLATKSLRNHVSDVAQALRKGLSSGRESVGKIVGRDTAEMDRASISRAALESLAENFSDGVVAPAFFYALFGLPGILAYKMANTADSMIGHRNDKYQAFGWASARSDDVLNLVPARLTALLILLAKPNRIGEGVRTVFRDAGKHVSPNAGWPEAALAGVLRVRLGGPRRYQGKMLDGVWLGSGETDIDETTIRMGLAVYNRAFILFWLAVTLLFTSANLTG